MKILIIDDSQLSRNMFKRALGDAYTYIEASDGMSGLEKYFLEKPDLVILDLTMPGTNGFEILAQLKQVDPEACVVVGTADIQSASQDQAMEMGAAGVIHKPFMPETVKETIERLLIDRKKSKTS
jgi:two-component system chemotaxis response regulator CheY